jgi:Bacterial mobilisation protein (MobC)
MGQGPARPSRQRVEDPRSAFIPPIRCTPAQRADAITAAERAGMSLGGFVRWRLFGTAGPRVRRRPSADAALLAQVLGQLGKRGANLNQIAHRLNLLDIPAPPEFEATVAEHRACVAAIMRALGLNRGADHH